MRPSVDDDENEAMNAKNDRALQRLLRESELLAQLKPVQGDKRPLRMKSTEASIIQLGGKPDRRKQLPFKERMQRMKEDAETEAEKLAEDRAAGIIQPKDQKQRKKRQRQRGGTTTEQGITRTASGHIKVAKDFAERLEARGQGKQRKIKVPDF